MIGKKYFTGLEIEGRLYGVNTLFTRNPNLPADWRDTKYPHIYIISECIEHEDFSWDMVRTLLQVGKIVTLEVTVDQIKQIKKDIFDLVHIQLSLDIPEFAKLKANDSLKIVTEPYTTFNVAKSSMQTTIPNDYKDDKPLD